MFCAKSLRCASEWREVAAAFTTCLSVLQITVQSQAGWWIQTDTSTHGFPSKIKVFQPEAEINVCLLQVLSGFNTQRERAFEFVLTPLTILLDHYLPTFWRWNPISVLLMARNSQVDVQMLKRYSEIRLCSLRWARSDGENQAFLSTQLWLHVPIRVLLPDSWFLCFRYSGSSLKAPTMSTLSFTLWSSSSKQQNVRGEADWWLLPVHALTIRVWSRDNANED